MPESAKVTYQKDLFCLSCGYNLRGLSGDPVRCPECGNDNPLEAILTPAATIAGQLRRLETAPTLCVAAVVSLLGGTVLLLSTIEMSFLDPRQLTAAIGVGFIVCAPIFWHIGSRRFASSCLHDPAWRRALARFILLSLVAFPVVYGACIIMLSVPFWIASKIDSEAGLLFSVVAICFSIASLWITFRIARLIHRRTTAIIIPLQRKVAVRLANEESPYKPPRSERDQAKRVDDE